MNPYANHTSEQLGNEFNRIKLSTEPPAKKRTDLGHVRDRARQLGEAGLAGEVEVYLNSLPATPATPTPGSGPSPTGGGMFSAAVILLLLLIAAGVTALLARKEPDTTGVDAAVKKELNAGILRQLKLGGALDKVDAAIEDRAFAQARAYRILGAVSDKLVSHPTYSDLGSKISEKWNDQAAKPLYPDLFSTSLAKYIKSLSRSEGIDDALLDALVNTEAADSAVDALYLSMLKEKMRKDELNRQVATIIKDQLPKLDEKTPNLAHLDELIDTAVVQANPYRLLLESTKADLTKEPDLPQKLKVSGERPFEGLGATIRLRLR